MSMARFRNTHAFRTTLVAFATAALSLLAPAPVAAQQVDPACTGQTLLRDACQKAADIFTFLTPQLGAVMAGGNALLGQGGALGGLPRIAVSVRANALRGDLPQVQEVPVSLGPAESDVFPVDEQIIGLPQVDVNVGLFRGLELGFTNVGAVDLLLSGIWVPELTESDVQLRAPDGQFKLGYGARVALLQETLATPSVAVTVMRRELPELSVSAQTGAGDSLSVSGVSLRTDSWRVVAGKSFLGFALSVGAGQDRIEAETALSAVVREGGLRFETAAPIPFAQEVTRSTLFADLALRLGLVQLVGEVGRVWGGELATFNEFDDVAADAARLYASAGLRLGF